MKTRNKPRISHYSLRALSILCLWSIAPSGTAAGIVHVKSHLDQNSVVSGNKIGDSGVDTDPTLLKMDLRLNTETNLRFNPRLLTTTAPAQLPNDQDRMPSNMAVPTCSLQIANYSANFFQHFLRENAPDFMPIRLVFKNTNRVNATYDLIQPLWWVWTRTYGVVHYLSWPNEFPILSLNLLRCKTGKPISLVFNAEPKNCQIFLGSEETTLRMKYALGNLTEQIVNNSNRTLYAFSKWCFKGIRQGFNTTGKYKAAVIFGWHIYVGNYRCYETIYDWWTRAINVTSPGGDIEQMPETDTGPIIASVIIFLFSPLVLIYIYPQAAEVTEDGEPIVSVLEENGGEDAEPKDDRDSSYVYLDGSSPIKLGKGFLGMCGLEKNHPILTSRIRRFLFLILSPSVIYVNVLLHAKLQKRFTQAVLVHEAPFGFVTVLSKDYGRHLFAPYFGGPIGLLVLYHLLGFILLVGPTSLSQVMTKRECLVPVKDIWPLCLRLNTIQEFSSYEFLNSERYQCFSLRLKAQFMMIWRPSFWRHMIQMQQNRFGSLFEACTTVRFGNIWSILLVAMSPIYVSLCFLELVLCAMFYGVPLVSFVILAPVSIYRHIKANLRLHFALLDVCFLLCFIACVSTFIYIFAIIFLHSVSLLAKISVFTYMAVIIYPSAAFGYVFFGTAILFYMYKLTGRIGQEYNDLLVHIVNMCKHFESCQCHYRLNKNTLQLFFFNNIDIQRIQIGEFALDLTQNVVEHLKGCACSVDNHNLIHDACLYTGVPRDLFNTIVKLHKPLYIQVFKTGLRIVLIIFLLSVTVEITNATGATSDISDVMHVFFIVVMGALPHVLDMPHSESTRKVKEAVWLKRIEQTILIYTIKRRKCPCIDKLQ